MHHGQVQVEVHPKAAYKNFLEQINKENITHFIVAPALEHWSSDELSRGVVGKFITSKYAIYEARLDGVTYSSRTLGYTSPTSVSIFRVGDNR